MLDKLATWEKMWQVEFHPQKCNLIYITTSLNQKTMYKQYILRKREQIEISWRCDKNLSEKTMLIVTGLFLHGRSLPGVRRCHPGPLHIGPLHLCNNLVRRQAKWGARLSEAPGSVRRQAQWGARLSEAPAQWGASSVRRQAKWGDRLSEAPGSVGRQAQWDARLSEAPGSVRRQAQWGARLSEAPGSVRRQAQWGARLSEAPGSVRRQAQWGARLSEAPGSVRLGI